MNDQSTATNGRTELTDKVVAWLAPRAAEMEALLHRLVDIDSSSFDKAGTDAVGVAIAELLASEGIAVSVTPKTGFGDIYRAELPGRQNGHVLLLGHRDTVFKKGTVTTRPYSRSGDLAYGPGVADMKGGLVANIFALRALNAVGHLPFPVVALFTADEEIGSLDSRADIEAAAQGARAVLNTEPGRVSGNVVTGRKGGGSFHIKVTGRAAHAGVNHADGASAIEALSRKIIRLHALTDYAAGITTNVGLIKGGNNHNTIAPWAEAELDLRVITLAQRAETVRAIEEIIHAEDVPGTTAELIPNSVRLPMEEKHSAALFAVYQAAAAQVGFAVGGEFTGGNADSGFTASMGIPTLCGLGPVGGKAHTDDEFCRLETLLPRTQALAATICALG